jgi:hypothetical protein
MSEMGPSIKGSLLEALNITWSMYEDAIENIPDEHWRTGDIDHLIPARLVYHVLEAADYYFSKNSDDFPCGHRFDVDWEKATLDQLPTKEQAREYLQDMVEKAEAWLGGMDDSELLSPEEAFPWTGTTVMGRALYALAHCRQHLGEINAELRRRDLPRIKWRTL